MSNEGTFRLLVPADRVAVGQGRSIELGQIKWIVTAYPGIPPAARVPEYTCISYSWGHRRTPNPLADGLTMSGRAIPAVETVIKALRPQAIWIDALCVPPREPERTACLRSMGAIYGSASQVAAVLSKSSSSVLKQIKSTGSLDPPTLLALEQDEWVSRAWTYQEMVNSRSFSFIAEACSDHVVSGDQFLNVVGAAISAYKKANGIDSFVLRTLHPRLDSLEDVIADWVTAAYLERTAYQVMSAMDRRSSEHPEDHFNAMIGAITGDAAEVDDGPSVHPAEYFMRVCEAKSDYSFIYSAAPRSDIPGKCWRPVAGLIPAVLPWHSHGDGQPGHAHPTHLTLEGMCRMVPGAATPTALQFIEDWLQSANSSPSSGTLAERTLAKLRQAGFSGSGEHLEVESGLFFPQSTLTHSDQAAVAVALGVKWVHGAPGLLLNSAGADLHRFGAVGVFVGPLPKTGNPINVM